MKIPKLKKLYIKLSGLVFLLLTAGFIGLAIFLPRLIDINAYRDDIMASLQKTINRKVTFANGKFSMHIGPSFVFDDVTVKEPDGINDFIKAKRITINLGLLPLLEKKIALTEITLEGPEIHLLRGSDGKLNIDDLLKPHPEAIDISFHKVKIKKGVLFWHDLAIQTAGFSENIRDLNVSLDNLIRGHKGNIKISGELPGAVAGAASLISLSGTAKLPRGTTTFMETELNANADVKHFDIGHYWPYYGRFIPFANPGGRLDIATSFKGKPKEFSAKGKLRINGIAISWPTVFHHVVNPRSAQLDYEIKLAKNSIDMPRLQLSADGFKIKGSCQVQDIHSSDPRITTKATSEPFKLEQLRQWIPYGIIATDASQYIEEHVLGGLFKLENGSLDGRISQIVHMEKATNYNVLHIKGTVEKGVLSYGKKVPTFTNIKGGLEMLGKDFILSSVNANFGESPFKMEGRITDYPLDTPCQYPFKMVINPRSAEVAWLAKLAGASKLEFSGNSALSLTGSGLVSAYHLSGEWDLKSAAYVFPGTVRKPAGTPNHLTFSTILGREETKLTSMAYTLAPLALSATATFKYGPHHYLGFELQTNQFLLNESLPILSAWQQYHPRGRIQAHIIGKGNPEDFSAMDYNGNINLAAFSCLPGEGLKTISNINGSISFKGNSLETSSISVLYGSSLVNAKGRIRSLKNREAEIVVSSPQFFLKDANLAPDKNDLSIKRMKASLTLQDKRYTIQNFTGLFNASNFSINGTYTSQGTPEANLSIISSNLDFEDLLLLSKLVEQTGTGEDKTASSKMSLKIKLAADAGSYQKIPYTKLNANITQENNVLYLQGFETNLFGGRLTAKGRIAPGGAPGSRYDLSFKLDQINADQLFQTLEVSREITGTMNVQGDITARGSSLAEIKKNALGNVRIHMYNGILRKFSVLSKVFSILNVSQLFKLHLPDMVAGGMPYDEIKGSIAIKDGNASSQDLFISGNAMNMSILGKADIVKEELDLVIGVQPLQTVDKIVNRIPVVGWLLTGKDKSVVTAYFEAKGKWSNPKVSAIPVKSLAKGALNVFRRVFELPVRLFTDTGEVILGN
ncbi:MAG TPA: AsmA-like C-terminal domain-containing protein [Desulfuromonadaceae bacterium]|jgi:uncharacterized protein involved in outer membrane biogenesis